MKDTSKLHLLMPDLLWPLEEKKLNKLPIRPPTLEKLLTRSRRAYFQSDDITEALFHLFGVESTPSADYPVGAVSYLGNGGETEEKCWAKAIPVHLIADGDGVLLIGPEQLDITLREAESLAKDFNEHFKQDGFSLYVKAQDSWHLKLAQCPDITTFDIDFVAGRHIQRYLPSGPDSVQWINIINETQMLFFHSEVNQQRMEKGSAAINGLWFFGFGVLPTLSKRYSSIYSTIPLAKGLAVLSNSTHYAQTSSFEGIQCSGQETIFTYTEFRDSRKAQDLSKWQEALQNIENWLKGVIRSNAYDELVIYNCMGKAFHVNRKILRIGFWKPNKSISWNFDSR
jgi:hypothetical protein